MATSVRQSRNFVDNVTNLEFMQWITNPEMGNNGEGFNGPGDRHSSLPHSVEVKRLPRLSQRRIAARDIHDRITCQGIPQPNPVNIRIREPYENKRKASTFPFD